MSAIVQFQWSKDGHTLELRIPVENAPLFQVDRLRGRKIAKGIPETGITEGVAWVRWRIPPDFAKGFLARSARSLAAELGREGVPIIACGV